MTDLRAELEEIVGAGALLSAPVDLIAYGFDGTFFDNTPPLVVLPASAAQVAAIHRVATARNIPLTPRAMGSGLSGGSVPLSGSIVLGVARMNRVIAIDPVDRVAVVEPGVIRACAKARSAATSRKTQAARAASNTGSPATTFWPCKSCCPTAASSAPAGARSRM